MFRFDNVIFHVHILEDSMLLKIKKKIPTKLIYTVNATLGRYPSSSKSVGKDFNRWYRTAYGRKMNLDPYLTPYTNITFTWIRETCK